MQSGWMDLGAVERFEAMVWAFTIIQGKLGLKVMLLKKRDGAIEGQLRRQ
jgi:hypothetical protein